MFATDGKDALIRLFFQFSALGETEWARLLLAALYDLDAQTARNIISSLPKDFPCISDSDRCPSRSRLAIISRVLNSENSEENGLIVNGRVGVLLDQLGIDEGWELGLWTSEGNDEDVPETLCAPLSTKEVDWMTERLLRLLPGASKSRSGFASAIPKKSGLKGVLQRVAETKPFVLWALVKDLREWIDSGVDSELSKQISKEISRFFDDSESSLMDAMERLLQSGHVRVAGKIFQFMQGDRLSEGDYRTVVQRAVKYSPASVHTLILQSSLSCPTPKLANLVQESMDSSVRDFVNGGGYQGGGLERKHSGRSGEWRSVGFQECRVMGWHTQGKDLELASTKASNGDFSIFNHLWKSGEKWKVVFGVLLAWDALSLVDGDSQVEIGKRQLLEAARKLPKILDDPEIAQILGVLQTELNLSDFLVNRFKDGSGGGGGSAGHFLKRLSRGCLLEILSNHTAEMDSDFVMHITKCGSHIPAHLHYGVLQDLQLVTSSGVALSLLAVLQVCSDLLDSPKKLMDQEKWLNESQSLLNSMDVCLSGLNGTFVHSWLLSLLVLTFKLVAGNKEAARKLPIHFMLGQKRGGLEGGGASKPTEVLILLRNLLDLINGSVGSITNQGDAWDSESKAVHLQYVTEAVGNLKLGMDILIKFFDKVSGLAVFACGWADVGAFLLTQADLLDLLKSQIETLGLRSSSLSDKLQKRTDSIMNGEDPRFILCGRLMEAACLLDKSLSSRGKAEEILHAFGKVAEGLTKQASASPNAPVKHLIQCLNATGKQVGEIVEHIEGGAALCEVLGKCMLEGKEESYLGPTKNIPRVRLVGEHLKALVKLRDAVMVANRGRLQYLSGLLHNLTRALTDNQSLTDLQCVLEVAGYGPSLDLLSGQSSPDTAKSSPFSTVGNKVGSGYLRDMVIYLANVGDIISTWDDGPTEGHNYFSMLSQTPQEVLTSLAGKSRCPEHIDAASRVATLLHVDLVIEVIDAWLDKVYVPEPGSEQDTVVAVKNGNGNKNGLTKKMPNLEAMRAFAVLSPAEVTLACALVCLQQDLLVIDKDGELGVPQKVQDVGTGAAVLFILEQVGQYPALENWMKMQIQQKCTRSAVEKAVEAELMGGRDAVGGPQQQIQNLLTQGELKEAFHVAEGAFPDGVPDNVLGSIVEATEKFPDRDVPVHSEVVKDGASTCPISWVACLRCKDNAMAVKLAGLRYRAWPLTCAVEFYSLLCGRISADDPTKQEVVHLLDRVKLHEHVMGSTLGREFKTWTEVDELFERDAGQLVRRLLAAGAVSQANVVVGSRDVPGSLKEAARAAYTQELANGSAAKGSGPAAALRYLKTFPPEEAFAVGMKVLTSAPSMRLCRLLVQFLMSLKSKLTPDSVNQLEQLRLGLAALRLLPNGWSDRCAHLVETPSLIVESLIMAQQTVAIKKLLEDLPALQDDKLLVFYARKALGLGPDSESLPFFLDNPDSPTSTSQSEIGSGSTVRLRPSFSRFPSEAGQSGAGILPVRVLSGIKSMDDGLRSRHSFRGAPNVTLFRVLADLCSSNAVAGNAAAKAATDLAESTLVYSEGTFEWHPETAQMLQETVDVCLELLEYADRKLTVNSGPAKDTIGSSTSTQATSKPQSSKQEMLSKMAESGGTSLRTLSAFSSGPPSALDGSSIRPDRLLHAEIELLQRILAVNIKASVSDLRDPVACNALLDRLIAAEQYNLAVVTARHCSMDERTYWEAWVSALIQEGNFEGARERVGNVFAVSNGKGSDDARISVEAKETAMRLVNLLEMTCPIDLAAYKRLQQSLKRSRWGSLLGISAGDLVYLLRGAAMQDTPKKQTKGGWFQRPAQQKKAAQKSSYAATRSHSTLGERLKRKAFAFAASSATLLEERIKFAEELLALHAPSMLIPFMFKHGRGSVACRVMFPKGMPDDSPPPLQPIPSSASSSSRGKSTFKSSSTRKDRSGSSSQLGRGDRAGASGPAKFGRDKSEDISTSSVSGEPLGSVSEIDVSVASEPEVLIAGADPYSLAKRVDNVSYLCELSVRYAKVESMISAMLNCGGRGKRALEEACGWLEREGRLRHLYKCQKGLGKVDLAGLTCVKLSVKSPDVETALRFLESAKTHFQEALTALQKSKAFAQSKTFPKSGGVPPNTPGAARSATPSKMTLSQGHLAQYLPRTTLQGDVYNALLVGNTAAHQAIVLPKDCSLFPEGAEETDEDERRKMRVVEELLGKDFNLAFRVLYEFRMPHTQAYATAASSMAAQRRHQAILDLIHNIKGTVTDQELDTILRAAVDAYTTSETGLDDEEWTLWFAEGLVDLMASPHAKVNAFLQLGDIERAYRMARERGGYGDLTTVAEFAEREGDKATVKKCEKILGRVRSGAE